MYVRFGFALPMLRHRIDPTELPRLAVDAEKAGFDSVWAADHVAVPEANAEAYGDVIEQLVTLTYIAAKTENLKVGTSVLIVPQRNPLVIAKQAAALDILSGGRLILGVGAGWIEGEFELLGADFAHRGKILDESIRLMRAMWREPLVNFSGDFFDVNGAVSSPKPAQPIPIWIGGNSDAAVRRAARLGDGWHPITIPPGGREAWEGDDREDGQESDHLDEVDRQHHHGGHQRLSWIGPERDKATGPATVGRVRGGGRNISSCESGADDIGAVSRDVATFAKEILPSF